VKVNAEEQDIINYIGADVLEYMKEGQQSTDFLPTNKTTNN